MTIVTRHDHRAFSAIIAGSWDIIVVVVLEDKKKFKREREDENDPAVLPEVRPYVKGCTALSAAKGLVTKPVLTIDIGGEEFLFMVDTGAMVSLIQLGISRAHVQPCGVQAGGVTCTQTY
jgi:hypothetical protein